ncbi:MAG: type IV pilus twitching motility protein PilT [Myxococcota bacterium]
MLDTLLATAKTLDASDVHLEPGLPVTWRVHGRLRAQGEPPTAQMLQELARQLLGARWSELEARGSADASGTFGGRRVRINVLRTSRGVGLALRLLSNAELSMAGLNLHPVLAQLTQRTHGLVIISGPTGSGKTSTLAAMVNEMNHGELPRHVITLESPIEYVPEPKRCFIRQREVGRDTPSFEQGIVDAVRENPDVLLVGEMREPEVMRLTLNAAETGHLVLTTLHAGTVVEALQRLVASFPPEAQPAVCAQVADALVAVVCQRLVYKERLQGLVPECELLMASTPVRAIIRAGNFQMIPTALESGGADGQYSWERYREWLVHKRDFAVRPSS